MFGRDVNAPGARSKGKSKVADDMEVQDLSDSLEGEPGPSRQPVQRPHRRRNEGQLDESEAEATATNAKSQSHGTRTDQAVIRPRNRDISTGSVAGATDNSQTREWARIRHMEKKATKFHSGQQYNLYHQRYWAAEGRAYDGEDPRWFILRSGLPFPSYHSNPTMNFPPRVSVIDGAKDPCEEIRAPRIRLDPQELEEKQYFLEAVKRKGEETDPKRIKCLNLSYQNLGEEYQYQQLLAFLKMNRGCETLCLTDNFLRDLEGFSMPNLVELQLARNNILSFKDIPEIPTLQRMGMAENFITNTDGLTHSKFPKLWRLTIKSNPISEGKDYRRKVKKAIRNVLQLDDTALEEY